ncbi:MAG: MarR family winged helix-turn-helix transcriptional regulator [Candidatus Gracilibacteria bacterium]
MHKGLHQDEGAKSDLEHLTMQQFQAILFVQCKKRVSMREVAEEMKVTPATATSLVEKLVRKGLLKRIILPENRRSVYITLSEHAEQHFEQMMEKKLYALSKVFSKMTEKDREDLLRVLTNLSEIVDKHSN